MNKESAMEITLLFRKAAEELPEKSGEYICCINGEWFITNYSAKHKAFNVFDNWSLPDVIKNRIHVTYWAELPKL